MGIQICVRSLSFAFIAAAFLTVGCGNQPSVGAKFNVGSSNINLSTSNSNSNLRAGNSNSAPSASVAEAKEPDNYQAVVNLKLDAVGDQQKTSMPTLTAKVARRGDNRRMEFTMPAGGRIVFLDLNGVNYLIMPEKNQYAQLDRESLGFETRRLLMPEQIVQQVRSIPGVQRVGEEKYNGRDVVRYEYGSVTNTQSRAGQVDTRSFILVDKETGLPLRTEAESKTQSGGSVQGYKGVRIVTEMSDISLDAAASLFERPADYQRIDSQQVRAQVDLIFNSLAAVISQLINQSKPVASPTISSTP